MVGLGFFVVYQSDYGSHFILGFTAQFYDGIYRTKGYNEIAIIARFDAKVTVTSVMKDLLNTISIKAGKVFTLTVPRSYRMEETRIEKKGIEIKSTGEIAVIGANHAPGSSDAFLALPTTTLGKTYVVATRLNSGPSLNLVNIGIISQRDGTKVTITLKTKGYFRYLGFTYTNGQSFTITLAKLETFHLMHNNDLSGTIITSSYPVAVLSGSPCENIGFSYCDHFVSFLLPVKKWGKQYILVPAIDSKNTGDLYRDFASQETMVKSRGVTKSLRRGEFLEISLTKDALSSFVSCSKPCQVVQYLKSVVRRGEFDPSSIILPSTEQFATSYKAVPMMKQEQFVHYIIIIIEEKNKDALKLNKTSNVKLNWHKVDDKEYAWAIHNISESVDVESCKNEKFGVIVFGYTFPKSYGYPAGFKFIIGEINSSSIGMSYVKLTNNKKPRQKQTKSVIEFLDKAVKADKQIMLLKSLSEGLTPQNFDMKSAKSV